MVDRIIRDIPELVQELREQQARQRDYVVPEQRLGFASDDQGLFLSIRGNGESAAYRLEDQVHGQFAQRYGIPLTYYSTLREKKAQDLLVTNLNYWVGRANGKRLVRIIDDRVRAFVSDRYRPLSHLDLLTTAVQVITGKEAEQGGYAKGAQCFGWHLSPKSLNVALTNPSIQVDLKNLEKGVQFNVPGVYTPDAPNHGWVRARGSQDGGEHWVFPAAFLGNSETGHGGLSVRVGLYEAICDNTARLGQDLAIRHLGKTLEEGEVLFSEKTQERENALIFLKVGDIIRQAFDPELLLQNAKRLKGLAEVEADIKEAATQIVKIPGITEGVRDDILAAYKPLTQGRDTLLDVQRAVTAAAHVYRQERPEIAEALETIGGALVEKGLEALVPAK